MDTDSPPLERAIAAAGSEEKLGKLIGYSQVAVNKAKRRGMVTAEMAVAIDRAGRAAGGISKEELRPDIFGPRAENSDGNHGVAG